jgi:hypothetical protein
MSGIVKNTATHPPIWADFGPLELLHDKPLSTVWTAPSRKALLKIYQQIEPRARRDREVTALTLAKEWGVAVPAVCGTGNVAESSWALLDLIPAAPCPIGTASGVGAYIQHTAVLVSALQSRSVNLRPGNGWLQTRLDCASHREFLLGLLSTRCRTQPWWNALSDALSTLDGEKTVYLHGDIKPEHVLVGSDGAHVVDWEAAARGPASCDTVHAVFHLIRDLVYAAPPPTAVPIEQLSTFAVPAVVAAWRIVHWLDRRRPADLNALQPDTLHRLLTTATAAGVAYELTRVVADLRARGVPR